MRDAGPKARTTKVGEPMPPEFREMFVRYGWERVERLFGKRASRRFVISLGTERMRAERVAFLESRRLGQPDAAAAHFAMYGTSANGGDARTVALAAQYRALGA